jgi:phage terminase small subunit
MKDTTTKRAPLPILIELPPPPFELNGPALEIYQKQGGYLVALEFLKASDLECLAIYANEVATYAACSKLVNTGHESNEPNKGFVVELKNKVTAPNQYRKLAEIAQANTAKLADKLGLTPTARRRMGSYGEGSIKLENQCWGVR